MAGPSPAMTKNENRRDAVQKNRTGNKSSATMIELAKDPK